MDVFEIQRQLVNEYKSSVESFVSIRDPLIRRFVAEEYEKDRYWPEALVQLNPTFAAGSTIPDLVARGVLHAGCDPIFRADKDTGAGTPSLLHRHQQDAIEVAKSRESYVLTTGTGSGKSLAYFIPIVARKDIEKYGEYRTKRLCLETYDHFAPETLRNLELRVRDIEQALRRRIDRAAGSDAEALPSNVRVKLLCEYAKHHSDATGTPTLREFLRSSYLTDLEKIARAEAIWPGMEVQRRSKGEFRDCVSDLSAFCNPMAHGRSVSEEVRAKGEAAVAWFEERLEVKTSSQRIRTGK